MTWKRDSLRSLREEIQMDFNCQNDAEEGKRASNMITGVTVMERLTF